MQSHPVHTWLVTPDGGKLPREAERFCDFYGIRVDDPQFDWESYAVGMLGCAIIGRSGNGSVVLWVNALRLTQATLGKILDDLPEPTAVYELHIEWSGLLCERYDRREALIRRLTQLVDVDRPVLADETVITEIDVQESIHPAIAVFEGEMRRNQWVLHDVAIQRLRRMGLWDRVLLFGPEDMIYSHVGSAFDSFFGRGFAREKIGKSVRDGTPNPDYCDIVAGLNAAFVKSGQRSSTLQLDLPNVWATDPRQPTRRFTYEKSLALVETPTGTPLIAKFTQSHLPLLNTRMAL